MLSGIKLINHKKRSITNRVLEINKPKVVYIPLVNHTNLECKCLVKIGAKVQKGEVIGVRDDYLELPIHASVSGKVIDIKDKLYLNGKKVKCVVIENDYQEKQKLKGAKRKLTNYLKEKFVELLKECAVTGMGGSDFPTYIKYQADLNTIIVNAVECEPYLTADHMITMLKIEEILETIDAVMEINNIKSGFIAIKETNYQLRTKIESYLGTYPNILLVTVVDIYPMGWEKYLIKMILKKEYQTVPSDIGVVVNNISTIYAIYKALKYQKPISKRIITISGEKIIKPQNVLVKIGTPIKDVINQVGGYDEELPIKLIAGGPMMGLSLKSDDIMVTKNLNGILLIDGAFKEEALTCLRCGRCVSICPVSLAPILIRDAIDDYEKLIPLRPERCIECGLCSYVCPSKIDVRGAVIKAKDEIRRH